MITRQIANKKSMCNNKAILYICSFALTLLCSSCLKDAGNNHYWAETTNLQLSDSVVVAEVWAEKSRNNDYINLQLLIKNKDLHSYYMFLLFHKDSISDSSYTLKNIPEEEDDVEMHFWINNDKYTGDFVSSFALDKTYPDNKISFEKIKNGRIDFNINMRLFESSQKFRKDTFELKSLSTIKCPIRAFD